MVVQHRYAAAGAAGIRAAGLSEEPVAKLQFCNRLLILAAFLKIKGLGKPEEQDKRIKVEKINHTGEYVLVGKSRRYPEGNRAENKTP
jgi:hypothetical protein